MKKLLLTMGLLAATAGAYSQTAAPASTPAAGATPSAAPAAPAATPAAPPKPPMEYAKLADVSRNTGSDIRIGLVNPLSGISKDLGSSAKNGAALAAAEINSRGGIDGRKIVLVSYDDKGTPDYAEGLAKEAILTGKLDAVLGPINTGVGVKINPQFQAAKIPMIVTSVIGSAPPVLSKYYAEPVNYIFRTIPPDFSQIAAIVRDFKDNKFKKVAVFADASPFGESGKVQLEKALKEANIEMVDVQRFKVGSKDLEAEVIKSRATNPDVAVVWGLGFDLAAVKIAMNRTGWRVPVYGSYTMGQADYLNASYSSANGTKIAMAFTEDSERPTAKHFMKNYFRFINSAKLASPLSAAAGYDAMYLMALAIKQAGSTNPDKIVAALENLDRPYYGVMKDYIKPYSKTNHEAFPNSDGIYMATAKDGKVLQYPDGVAGKTATKAVAPELGTDKKAEKKAKSDNKDEAPKKAKKAE